MAYGVSRNILGRTPIEGDAGRVREKATAGSTAHSAKGPIVLQDRPFTRGSHKGGIRSYHSTYYSIREVKERLVIRVNRGLSDTEPETMNRRYVDPTF